MLEQGFESSYLINLNVSDKLEKIRDANDRARERQLAEQQLREGKEQVVEKKMQTALSALIKDWCESKINSRKYLKFFKYFARYYMGKKRYSSFICTNQW